MLGVLGVRQGAGLVTRRLYAGCSVLRLSRQFWSKAHCANSLKNSVLFSPVLSASSCSRIRRTGSSVVTDGGAVARQGHAVTTTATANTSVYIGLKFRPAQFDQIRTLFIRTGETPNPKSLKFFPGKNLMPEENETGTLVFSNYAESQRSPLASKLFAIEGVTGVLVAKDFVTVSITDETQWSSTKPEVFAVISDFIASGLAIVTEKPVQNDTAIQEEDDEVVAMIKEIIDTRVRPAVQQDGGDIVYRGFSNGIVKLQLQGSCSGCPSSSVTLKAGIENMLTHYVPEVEGVEEYVDEQLQTVSDHALSKLEEGLAKVKASTAKATSETSTTSTETVKSS